MTLMSLMQKLNEMKDAKRLEEVLVLTKTISDSYSLLFSLEHRNLYESMKNHLLRLEGLELY